MANIHPFKAIRPTRDKAHLVASRPIASYKPSILAAKLEENPFTFIHIIHPEYFEDETNKTAPNTRERFEKVKNKFNEFCGDGIFTEDEKPCLYIYQQTKDNHAFLGIIGGASVEEYKNNTIKKHEATLTSREEMFTNYLEVVGINAEPVLLSYPSSQMIDELLFSKIKERPEYEFTTTDKVKHELWIIENEECEAFQTAFQSVPSLYIADGHHRSASSVRLSERLNQKFGKKDEANHNHFLSFFIDEKRLQIYAYNRLVKHLGDKSKEELLVAFSQDFEVTALNGKQEPQKLHDIHCFFGEKWYLLRCKAHIIENTHSAVDSIDAEILTKYILQPHLNIQDLKTDDNIDFVSGESGLEKLEQKVCSGKFAVGFALYPVLVEQIKQVADENAIMPPKSTWVEPKMRSGLTIYPIHND